MEVAGTITWIDKLPRLDLLCYGDCTIYEFAETDVGTDMSKFSFPPVPIYSVTVLNMSQSSNDVSNGLHGRGHDRNNGTIKSLQGLLYWELRTTRWKTYHFKFRKGCLRFNANQKYWMNVRYHEIRNENSTVYVSPTVKPLIMISNKLVNHSEVGALPVGAASITSSFLTKTRLQWIGQK